MQYADALRYLYSLGNEVLTAKLGLHNISTLLESLGNPHRHFDSVLIAGTNGKGSVAAFIESALRRSSLITGLYTSPHLMRIEERIRVRGNLVSAEDFAKEPHRNKLNLIINRTNHQNTHYGQLIYLKPKN